MDDLQTIKDFVRYGASRFEEAKVGCISPYNEAYSLIQHVLHLKQIPDKLLDAKLDREEITKIKDLFDKRIDTHKPVPYLINKSIFAGKSFYVDKRVLIPRSPIQLYIENEFKCLNLKVHPRRILDLGTGSGCIGIATALIFPNAIVDLSDISKEALEVAQINIDRYNLKDRVHIIESDLFKNIPDYEKVGRYDLILCNPPYVNKKQMVELKEKREISEHEPEWALYGGLDGLDHVTNILNEVANYLTEEGILIIEIAQNKMPLYKKFPNIKWNTPLKSIVKTDGIDNLCPTIFIISKEEFKK